MPRRPKQNRTKNLVRRATDELREYAPPPQKTRVDPVTLMKASGELEEKEKLYLLQSQEAPQSQPLPETAEDAKEFVPHAQLSQTDAASVGSETMDPTVALPASQLPDLLSGTYRGNVEPLYHTRLNTVTLALLMVFMTSMWYEAKAISKILDKTAQVTIHTLFGITPRTAHQLFEAARGLLQQCLADVTHGVPPPTSETVIKKEKDRKTYNWYRERIRRLKARIKQSCGMETMRTLTEKFRKFAGMSLSTIWRMMKKYFKSSRIHQVPLLTGFHRQLRKRFVFNINHRRGIPATRYYNAKGTVLVHVDEKHFYAYSRRRRVYTYHTKKAVYMAVPSKTQVPKMSFFAAIGRPMYDRNGKCLFDGKVLFQAIKT